ncbi:MAG TPA: hypothetical protein DCM62_05380, partial [Bacteroidales bacterium]|nr:hypothetical protein [Bacteroidales bacterium]
YYFSNAKYFTNQKKSQFSSVCFLKKLASKSWNLQCIRWFTKWNYHSRPALDLKKFSAFFH